MYQKRFTLKQHTPIIHFQHDEQGATLRATELKPKLDRFLLEKEPTLPAKEHPNGARSLDYKVKIEPDPSNPTDIDSRKSLYFGNMGEGKDKKYKRHKGTFKVAFYTFVPEVKEAIEKHFEAFLANTNFGTRQSKGYGGFYLNGKSFDSSLIPYKVYSFSSRDWEKDVKILYQFLRQGINIPKGRDTFYSKPAIFSYAKSKGWTWEKKAIKQFYFRQELEMQVQEHHSADVLAFDSNEKHIVRDLFGLSSEESWLSYKASISKENPDIKRFKSPITFKIVDGRVYFWANDTVGDILDEEFTIKKNNRGDLELDTPQEFDFDNFFDFTFKIDLSNHIENEFHDRWQYKTLERIFKEIKENA